MTTVSWHTDAISRMGH